MCTFTEFLIFCAVLCSFSNKSLEPNSGHKNGHFNIFFISHKGYKSTFSVLNDFANPDITLSSLYYTYLVYRGDLRVALSRCSHYRQHAENYRGGVYNTIHPAQGERAVGTDLYYRKLMHRGKVQELFYSKLLHRC